MQNKPKAVICDLYGTLLYVDTNKSEQEACSAWEITWQRDFGRSAPVSWEALPAEIHRRIVQEHTRLRSQSVDFPEIDFTSVLANILAITREQAQRLARLHASLSRKCSLMPGAAAFLTQACEHGILLGICSNGQEYSLGELTQVLVQNSLESPFHPELCFWSYQHGFAKPSSQVYVHLEQKLALLGISAAETLMVGDNRTNDILPPAARGWQTWHFTGIWPSLAG